MFQEKPQAGMNLPVASHVTRLAEMVSNIKADAQALEKDLHMLRGSITQLSYVNKDSDRELNEFLIESIGSLRQKWEGEWEGTQNELAEQKKRVHKLWEEHEDVELGREELGEKVLYLEEAVGLRQEQ